MKHSIISIVAAVTLSFSITQTAQAERYIVVNGKRLNGQEIAFLERIRCGPIPNGHYWLNTHTGVWGYANNPYPQGNITDNCYRRQRRPSLSERGMLFSPYDWVR